MKLIDYQYIPRGRASNLVFIDNCSEDDFNELKELKKQIGSLDFHCAITENGCVVRPGNKMCCCDSCFSKAGYLEVIRRKDLCWYERLFTRTGFWRKEGCILPVEFRSRLCLTMYCGPYTNKCSNFISLGPQIRQFDKDIQVLEKRLKMLDKLREHENN